MNIKKFEASDTRSALRMVRAELGEDAVILSNKTVNGGIEIISASDFDDALFERIQRPRPGPEAPAGEDVGQERSDAVSSLDATELDAINTSLRSIRELMEQQSVDFRGIQHFSDNVSRMARYARLLRHGFTAEVANILSDELEVVPGVDISTDALEPVLSRQLGIQPSSLLNAGGTVALVGPTGVGKTTTIAKIAAQFSLRHGSENVALIAADQQRIGAADQLGRIASVLGIRVYDAPLGQDLGDLLRNLAHIPLVLLDTAGVSQSDPRLDSMLADLRNASRTLRIFLTLAANTEKSCLDWVLSRYKASSPDAIVLTKIDECARLGPALSALINSGSNLELLTDGQDIPDDLYAASARSDWLTNRSLIQENTTKLQVRPARTDREITHVSA